jgi:hypothetical protein
MLTELRAKQFLTLTRVEHCHTAIFTIALMRWQLTCSQSG